MFNPCPCVLCVLGVQGLLADFAKLASWVQPLSKLHDLLVTLSHIPPTPGQRRSALLLCQNLLSSAESRQQQQQQQQQQGVRDTTVRSTTGTGRNKAQSTGPSDAPLCSRSPSRTGLYYPDAEGGGPSSPSAMKSTPSARVGFEAASFGEAEPSMAAGAPGQAASQPGGVRFSQQVLAYDEDEGGAGSISSRQPVNPPKLPVTRGVSFGSQATAPGPRHRLSIGGISDALLSPGRDGHHPIADDDAADSEAWLALATDAKGNVMLDDGSSNASTNLLRPPDLGFAVFVLMQDVPIPPSSMPSGNGSFFGVAGPSYLASYWQQQQQLETLLYSQVRGAYGHPVPAIMAATGPPAALCSEACGRQTSLAEARLLALRTLAHSPSCPGARRLLAKQQAAIACELHSALWLSQ